MRGKTLCSISGLRAPTWWKRWEGGGGMRGQRQVAAAAAQVARRAPPAPPPQPRRTAESGPASERARAPAGARAHQHSSVGALLRRGAAVIVHAPPARLALGEQLRGQLAEAVGAAQVEGPKVLVEWLVHLQAGRCTPHAFCRRRCSCQGVPCTHVPCGRPLGGVRPGGVLVAPQVRVVAFTQRASAQPTRTAARTQRAHTSMSSMQ